MIEDPILARIDIKNFRMGSQANNTLDPLGVTHGWSPRDTETYSLESKSKETFCFL